MRGLPRLRVKELAWWLGGPKELFAHISPVARDERQVPPYPQATP